MTDSQVLCRLSQVGHQYSSQGQLLFSCVNADVPPGNWIHLKGVNGSGKTTLLKIIAGIVDPISGSVEMTCAKGDIGLLFAKSGLMPRWTVAQSLEFWRQIIQVPCENQDEVTRFLKLKDVLSAECGTLSSGWLRRVAFARVLLRPRKLYLLDEIGIYLDQDTLKHVTDFLSDRVKQGASVVYTSHDPTSISRGKEWHIRGGTVAC